MRSTPSNSPAAEAEREGRATIKLMQEGFQSFGVSIEDANKRIGMLAQKAQEDGFRLVRLRDVVYTVEVAGPSMVEVHAIPGGSTKQTVAYRIKKLEETLPNLLAIVQQLEVAVVFVPMPKAEAKPYAELMKQFGFTAKDIPEDTGAKDMVAYIARIR